MSRQIEMIKSYISAVENLTFNEKTSTELLHPDYIQWELPNILNPLGQRSDTKESLKRLETAKSILSSQKYEISSLIEQGEKVVMEALWVGTLAISAGPLKKGQTLKAFFCMVFEFYEGKIHRIRNYDCFEPLDGGR